jgi:hypothetical protein
MQWYQFKLFAEHATSIDMPTLHVLAGVLLQILACVLFRKPISHWVPWVTVLSLEVLNEWSDLHLDPWPDPGMQYGEGFQDLWLTMLLPTVLLIVARYCPRLLTGRQIQDPS